MARSPTDLAILNTIYDRYYYEYLRFSKNSSERESKIYVPIDCAAIAQDLSSDPDIIFGRLYYDLEKRYGYEQKDGSVVRFFAFQVGEDRHAVHFPYLASVVANLRSESRRHTTATVVAVASFVVSLISLAVSIGLAGT